MAGNIHHDAAVVAADDDQAEDRDQEDHAVVDGVRMHPHRDRLERRDAAAEHRWMDC